MAHPRVEQHRFARAEWVRGLRGLREEDGIRRLEPMNSISWMVGHLAWHERLMFLERAQGLKVEPVLDAVAFGMPASTPSLKAMWASWTRMTEAADPFLDALTTEDLLRPWPHDTRSARTVRRLAAPAHHVPLLAPHRRGLGGAPAHGPHAAGLVRRRHRARRPVPAEESDEP